MRSAASATMTNSPYDKATIKRKLGDYPGWNLSGSGQLYKEFIFKNFAQVMLFACAVGHLAEAADHHPDLNIHSYKYLVISLMTHSAGGITERDFDLIGQIEALPQAG